MIATTMLVAPLAADTAQWTEPVNLSALPGRSTLVSTLGDPATGDILVVWMDDGVADLERILLRRYDATTGFWLPVENLSTAAPAWAHDRGALLVRDSSGLILAVWTRTYQASGGAPADGYDIVSRAWDGTAWSQEQIILHENAYLPGSYNLVPAETTGGTLLFLGWGYEHRLTRFQGGAWLEPGPWMDLGVELAQVIVDAQGTLHASAFGPNSTTWGANGLFSDAYYLTSQTGESWSTAVNVSSFDGVTNSVGLAFDAQGRLHFLWSDPHYLASVESTVSAIWERVLDSGEWGPNVDITGASEDLAINSLSLAADEQGAFHLGWSEGTWSDGSHLDLDIYYRPGDGDTWGSPTQVHTSTLDSRYPLIVLNERHPYLVWEEIDASPGPGVRGSDVYYSHPDTRPPPPPPLFNYYLPLVAW
ncbi:MAG: hypothetical protein JXA93_25055 [Anaerolineae bacterium]|nr:hypothetical protein [Anaerolineae bacterium]